MKSKHLNKLICASLCTAMVASVTGCGTSTVDETKSTVETIVIDTTGEVVDYSSDEVTKEKVDDFYMFVNEDWINAVELEADEITCSRKDDNYADVYEKMGDMLSAMSPDDFAEDDPMRKMVEYYQQLQDPEQRTELAMQSIKSKSDRILSVKNMKELQVLMNDSEYSLYNPFCVIKPQISTALDYIPSFYMTTLYGIRGEYGDDHRQYFIDGITSELELLGYSTEEARKIAENANEFDKRVHEYNISNGTWGYYSEETYQDVKCTVDLMGILKANDFYMTDKFGATDFGTFVFSPYIDWLNENVNNDNIEMVRDFYAVSMIEALHMSGTNELQNARYSGILGFFGGEMVSDDDMDDYSHPINALLKYDQGAVADCYSGMNITEEQKNEILSMAHEIVDAYVDVINETEWLDTKQKERLKARTKLTDYQIGAYADFNHLEDFEICDCVTDTMVSLMKSNRRFEQRMYVQEQLYTPTDFNLYYPNACYYADTNTVLITAAYIADDYLWNEATYEERMAVIGTTVAHELAHAYDTGNVEKRANGDVDEKWVDFWDYYLYSAEKVYNYFDGKKTSFGTDINPGQYWDEAYSDIFSMQVIMRALAKHEDVDYDLFFKSYAMDWAEYTRPEAIEILFMEDSHLPSWERVNSTLYLLDEFYETYDVNPDSQYYVEEADRFKIFDYVEE